MVSVFDENEAQRPDFLKRSGEASHRVATLVPSGLAAVRITSKILSVKLK